MARKLKTFVTTIGFFEHAIAAPSMKAALDAWGVTQNLFQQGFAAETDDPAIITAAAAHPGTVLKRPIGSKGAFQENPKLPKSLSAKPAAPPDVVRMKDRKLKRPPKSKPSRDVERAQILSLEKARVQREGERAKENKEREKQEAAEARTQERRTRAVDKAKETLDRARERHDARIEEYEREIEAAERKVETERVRWEHERDQLESLLRKARREP